MEWTDRANHELDEYLERMRSDLAAQGADPDEVSADLRRHIHEELAELNLQIVTCRVAVYRQGTDVASDSAGGIGIQTTGQRPRWHVHHKRYDATPSGR